MEFLCWPLHSMHSGMDQRILIESKLHMTISPVTQATSVWRPSDFIITCFSSTSKTHSRLGPQAALHRPNKSKSRGPRAGPPVIAEVEGCSPGALWSGRARLRPGPAAAPRRGGPARSSSAARRGWRRVYPPATGRLSPGTHLTRAGTPTRVNTAQQSG